MKIEIIKTIEQKEIIDVEFPYYYKYDLMLDHCDSIIYGKINKNSHYKIYCTKYYNSNEKTYKLEIEKCHMKFLSSYFKEEYKSTEKEFLEAMRKFQKAWDKV